jgi:uncharacterized membrane protein YedE/YeeE
MTSLFLKQSIIALFSGLLFGAGLAVSGMNDTTKVQGFLDLFGAWDITLAFVMMGALSVGLISFRFILKQDKPAVGKTFNLPTNNKINGRLISGAVLFGLGWGLVGYCPGPAIASLSYGYWQTLIFVAAMLAGSKISKQLLP